MRRILVVILSALTLGALACASTSSSTNDTSSADGNLDSPMAFMSVLRQGQAFFRQGRYEAALERFSVADKAQPDNATVANMKGRCLLQLGRHAEALTEFDRAVELIPSYTDARNNRGATYLTLGQYRMAEVDFIAALSDTTYENHWRVYHNLGLTYLRRGDQAAAEENFRRAALAPQPVLEAWLELAELSARQHDVDKGLLALESASSRFPGNIQITLTKGKILAEAGRFDEAEPYLQDVANRASGTSAGNRARQLLALR